MFSTKNLNKIVHFFWIFFKYLSLSILTLIIFTLIIFASNYKKFQKTAQTGLKAKESLNLAITDLKSKKWTEALEQSTKAQNNFSLALISLQSTQNNFFIKNIKIFNSQINDLKHLLKSGEIISNSLKNLIPLAQKVDDFKDLKNGEEYKIIQTLYRSEPELTGLKANLDLAILNLEQIHDRGILWPIADQISNIKNELEKVSGTVNQISPVLSMLPTLGGAKTSNFLLILQNNDELRPSGGFIGSYALLKIKSGKIVSLTSSDSYHLDMPASLEKKWKMSPPEILKKYLKVEKWYLRDANWSPDWPQAAQKINQIYQGENQAIGKTSPKFTGIIAINPDLIANLIKLTGPISFQGANYNSDNFQSLLQYNVEIAYKEQNISSWNRKNIINHLIEKLRDALISLPSKDWPELLNIITKNIDEKNIQIYFFDSKLEKLAQKIGASGTIPKTQNDFLMVVDANLAAFKSDAVLKKDLAYSLKTKNNQALAKLSLNYQHTGHFDWRTTRYRSYTRVYVPFGSKLQTITGLNQKTANIKISDDINLDKTIFGFFMSIEPGQSKKITINYTLPERIKKKLETNNYQLLVERQSGQKINSLQVDLNSGLPGQKKSWLTDLQTNKIFKLP